MGGQNSDAELWRVLVHLCIDILTLVFFKAFRGVVKKRIFHNQANSKGSPYPLSPVFVILFWCVQKKQLCFNWVKIFTFTVGQGWPPTPLYRQPDRKISVLPLFSPEVETARKMWAQVPGILSLC